MGINMIILLPIVAGFGLLYWASQLEEDQAILKLMFQLMFIPLIWISSHFAVIDAQINYGSNEAMVTLLSDFVYYLGWVFFIVGAYICLRIFLEIKDWFVTRKKKKQEEKYG